MTDRAVLLPERFRAGCAFGAGPVLAGPVSPTGQIEVGILPPVPVTAKLSVCTANCRYRRTSEPVFGSGFTAESPSICVVKECHALSNFGFTPSSC